MPAKASDPPDGISTVVSARRVLIEGTVSDWVEPGTAKVKAFSVDRSETSVITLRLMRPSDSTTGVKTRLTPNFLKSICGWQTGGDLVVSHDSPLGIGNSPPATKARGLAGDRGQVRLGQRADHAGAVHRPQRRGDIFECAGERSVAERLTGGGERVLRVEVHHGAAVVEGAAEIDAELLDDVAPHFGDRHLEHDLVAPAHGDAVDHLGAVADQPRGEIVGLLRLRRRSRRCRTA